MRTNRRTDASAAPIHGGSASQSLETALHINAKVRQALKIREIKSALISSGLMSLDEQAKALGLCRSTTWTVLTGKHKATGLSAATVNRMLSSPELPPLVRTKVVKYAVEKSAGYYGRTRRFSRLAAISRHDQEFAVSL